MDSQSAMLGVALNPLGFGMECQRQESRGDGTFLVSLMVRIPVGGLILKPDAVRHAAQISLFSVVRDEQDILSDVHKRSYPIDIASDRLLSLVEHDNEFVVGMVLREGPHRIAVSVRGDRSRTASTAYVDVMVGAGDEEQGR